MMRRIDLLPAAVAERRRQRRNLALVGLGGLVVVAGLMLWWFMLGGQINDANEDLAQVQATNQQLEAQIAELQRFADLAAEVEAKRIALQTVMAGDVSWPSVMTELAMVIPGEVWLTGLDAFSAAGGGGVGTETAPIDISAKPAVGRVSFQGRSLTMTGVAKWLIRLGLPNEFIAAWLEQAAADETGTVDFTSTIELSDKAVSGRFQRDLP